MLRSVFGKTLFDYRRSMMWWMLGFIVLAIYMIAFFPSLRDNKAMQDLANAKLDLMKALIGNVNIGTPIGFLTGSLFSLTLPMVLLFFTIGAGANAISGEESRKTMDLLLAHPIPRWRVVLEKFGAMVFLTALLGFVMWIAFVVGAPRVKLFVDGLTMGTLAAGIFSISLMCLLYGTLALAIGAATGSKGMALGITSAVAVVNYLIKSMAHNVSSLNTAQKAMPMYYAMSDDYNPLASGLSFGYTTLLVVGIVILLGVALVTFERRDVAV